MKKTLLLLLFLFTVTLQSQAILTSAQILNIAGKQRLLSQKMARAKLCIYLGINAPLASKELSSNMIIFDENLKLLLNFSSSSTIKLRVNQEQIIWKVFQNKLNDFTDIGMKNAMSSNTELLMACEDLVQELRTYFSKNADAKNANEIVVGEAVVNAGSLRYLSQRLALYSIYTFDNKVTDGQTELKETIFRFDTTITGLLTCECNNTETDEAVSQVYNEWNKIKGQTKNNKMDPVAIIDSCNVVLQLADKLTTLYVGLLK